MLQIIEYLMEGSSANQNNKQHSSFLSANFFARGADTLITWINFNLSIDT